LRPKYNDNPSLKRLKTPGTAISLRR